MPLAPISIQLSNFEQIEILRNEIEQFEEELKKTEVRIRAVLYQVEKQRYLGTVHPVFQSANAVADSQALPELYSARETLAGAIEAMKAAMAALEAITGPVPSAQRAVRPGQQLPRTAAAAPVASNPANPGLRRNRFDAF